MSGTSGSSGFGSQSREQMDNKTGKNKKTELEENKVVVFLIQHVILFGSGN